MSIFEGLLRYKDKGEERTVSMKNIRVLCFVLMFILSASCFSFATVPEVLPEKGNEIELQYVATSRVTPLISISGGVVDYSVTVIPKSSTSIGYIEATIKLVRTSTGVTTKTTRGNMYQSSGKFKLSDSKTLTSKGEYHIEYTLKVYKSGSLVETLTGKSATAKY